MDCIDAFLPGTLALIKSVDKNSINIYKILILLLQYYPTIFKIKKTQLIT
jgi:hypothetical protein